MSGEWSENRIRSIIREELRSHDIDKTCAQSGYLRGDVSSIVITNWRKIADDLALQLRGFAPDLSCLSAYDAARTWESESI